MDAPNAFATLAEAHATSAAIDALCDATEWLATGPALPLNCTRCEDHGRLTPAVTMPDYWGTDHLCRDCYDDEAEGQSEARDADYYGGSTPTFAETVRGAS